MFMRRNLTGVRSGPSYAGALSSDVVDGGTGLVIGVACGSLRFRYINAYCFCFFDDLEIFVRYMN